ncbi:hypothetical protein SISSUDRAFT_1036772 [Sistotremastrum suecicum HHB10207 ss-3]|uniref:Uncharacterized protein n=1 Tax=Sistotremastrum suecicum HHB10207 ss-3 TaxID=1314776 RepID=A0A165Z0M4_9AGAM|nr:hypothetical protein SISSUDRAFT_1036772 [Sistotremastrum suecicum HHB10207 ss-3]
MFSTIPSRYRQFALDFCGTIHDWDSKIAVQWQPLPPVRFSTNTPRNGIVLTDHANGDHDGELLHPGLAVNLGSQLNMYPVLNLGWPGVPGPHYPLVAESMKELANQVYNATKAAFERLGKPYGPGMRLVPIHGHRKALLLRFDDLVLHAIVNTAPGHWQAEFSLLNMPHELSLACTS